MCLAPYRKVSRPLLYSFCTVWISSVDALDFSLEKKRETQEKDFSLRFEFTIVNKSSVPILVVEAQWLWKTLWSPKRFQKGCWSEVPSRKDTDAMKTPSKNFLENLNWWGLSVPFFFFFFLLSSHTLWIKKVVGFPLWLHGYLEISLLSFGLQ